MNIYTDDYKVILHKLIADTFNTWEGIAFYNERLFLESFARIKEAWVLQNVSWNSEIIYFVYVLNNGQHIGDSSPIQDWYKFLEKINND